MMKKTVAVASMSLVVAAGIYLFRAQLWDMTAQKLTDGMFVETDTDAFNPGIAVGSQFPDIYAQYQGREVIDAGEFIHDKGMVFIANRSADW